MRISENDDFKVFLINELKDAGYTDETEGKELGALKEALSFQKKLNYMREKQKEPPKAPEQKTSKIKPIDMSRENAMAFSEDIIEYFIKENQAFDERIIDDERFKRNVKVTTPERPNLTMVLRDADGRCY